MIYVPTSFSILMYLYIFYIFVSYRAKISLKLPKNCSFQKTTSKREACSNYTFRARIIFERDL